MTARITDAGDVWLIAGTEESAVRACAIGLRERGGEITVSSHRAGDRWYATVRKPRTIERDQCTVQRFGAALEVTGPTREAVVARCEELLARGATMVCEVYESAGVWHGHLDRAPAGVMVI